MTHKVLLFISDMDENSYSRIEVPSYLDKKEWVTIFTDDNLPTALNDQGVFYYNFGGDIEAPQRAEVFFMGNSRLQHALDSNLLNKFFDLKNKSYYTMGLPHVENGMYFRMLFEKYKFNSKVLFISGEGFFREHPSDIYKKYWGEKLGFKKLHQPLDAFFSYWIFNRVVSQFPIFVGRNSNMYKRKTLNKFFRNRDKGYWHLTEDNTRGDLRAVRMSQMDLPKIRNFQFEQAKWFKNYSKENGMKLYILYIPSTEQNESKRISLEISKKLGIDFIDLEATDYETFDGSHLTRKSANILTTRLLRKVDSLGIF